MSVIEQAINLLAQTFHNNVHNKKIFSNDEVNIFKDFIKMLKITLNLSVKHTIRLIITAKDTQIAVCRSRFQRVVEMQFSI